MYIDFFSVHGKKGMTVIECAVGFSVIPHPSTGILIKGLS